MEEIVNLDDLKEKQRGREYKTTAKDIRSKDFDTRNKALQKLKDHRYFTQGKCFESILASISTNKKMIELSKIALDSLISFLETSPMDVVFETCRQHYEEIGNIEQYQALVDIVVMREDIKKPKLRKGDDPAAFPTPTEHPTYATLRNQSLKSMFLILKSSNKANESNTYWSAWPHIPNLSINLFEVLSDVHNAIGNVDKSVRYEALQRGIWALVILVKLMKCDTENSIIDSMLSHGDLFQKMLEMINEPVLTIHVLKIFHFISFKRKYIAIIASNAHMGNIISVLNTASNDLKQLQEQTTIAANTKNKQAKKDQAKPKKGEIVSENIENKLFIADLNRLAVAYLKLGMDILTSIAQVDPILISDNVSSSAITLIRTVLDSNVVWQISNSPESSETLDVPLNDIIEKTLVLTGVLGSVSNSIRVSLTSHGVLSSLFDILKVSKEAYTDNSTTGELYLSKLRSVLEKTLDILVKNPTIDTTCHNLDEEQLLLSKINSLIDILQTSVYSNDMDLFGRGVRILHQMLITAPNAVELMKKLSFNETAIVTALSEVFDVSSELFLKELNSNIDVDTSLNAHDSTTTTDNKTGISNIQNINVDSVKESTEEEPRIATEQVQDVTANRFLQPTVGTNCYHIISIIKLCIDYNIECVNIFVGSLSQSGTSNRLTSLAQLLSRCGPSSTSPKVNEYKASIYDWKRLDWSLKSNEILDSCRRLVNLRPAVLSLASCIVDSAINSAQSATMQYPMNLITYNSPYEDSSQLTIVESFECCCNILLIDNEYQLNKQSNITIKLPDISKSYPLESDVLFSAIKFICSVGNTGIYGICAALESFNKKKNQQCIPGESSIYALKHQLIHLLSISQNDANEVLLNQLNEEFIWSRPKYYDQLITTIIPTNINYFIGCKGLWPFMIVMTVLVRHIADPRLPHDYIDMCLKGLISFTKTIEFEATNQPVLMDIFSSVFLSIGGGILLSGLCGRFGLFQNDRSEMYLTGLSLLNYIINRSSTIEKYWITWHNERTVDIDPKTGKPKSQQKKRDKYIPSSTERKKNKKGGFSGTIIEDWSYNYEPDIDSSYLDPNHGPSQSIWVDLLDIYGSDQYTRSQWTTMLHVLIQNNMNHLLNNNDIYDNQDQLNSTTMILSMIDLHVNVNAQDEPNQATPLMYSLLFGNEIVSRVLIDGSMPIIDRQTMTADSSHSQLESPIASSPLKSTSKARKVSISQKATDKKSSSHIQPKQPANKLQSFQTQKPKPVTELDIFDAYGNPLIKYAFLSMSNDQLNQIFSKGFKPRTTLDLSLFSVNPLKTDGTSANDLTLEWVKDRKLSPKSKDNDSIDVYGSAMHLSLFQRTAIDVNIADSCHGNYPLHYALGLCDLSLTIAGYPLALHYTGTYPSITGTSINQMLNPLNAPIGSVYEHVLLLERLGVDVNRCNKQGIVPFHIAALKGDLTLLAYFLKVMKCHSNACSSINGYLSFHFLSLGCPKNAIACFDYLCSISSDLPIEITHYNNNHKNKTKNENYIHDMYETIDDILDDTIAPSSIKKKRYQIRDLLLLKTTKNENILNLAMASHCYERDSLPSIRSNDISINKDDRMKFVLHILYKAKEHDILTDMVHDIDDYHSTILHTSTILFHGITMKSRILSQKELKSKRIKYYESIEKEIIDILYTNHIHSSIFQFRDRLLIESTRKLSNRYQPIISSNSSDDKTKDQGWTIFHGVISSNNYDYAEYLITDISIPLYTHAYIHYLANHNNCSQLIARLIIRAYTKSSSIPYSTIALNGIDYDTHTRPIHLAIKNKNIPVMKELFKSVKFNPNLRDERTGDTPFHYACKLGDLSIIDMFGLIVDKIDFLIEDKQYQTCIETVIDFKRHDILERLLRWRPNDVMERIISVTRYLNSNTILLELEQEHIDLVEILKNSDDWKIQSDSMTTKTPMSVIHPWTKSNETSPTNLLYRDASFKVNNRSDQNEEYVTEQFMKLRLKECNEKEHLSDDIERSTVQRELGNAISMPVHKQYPSLTNDNRMEFFNRLKQNTRMLEVLLPHVLDLQSKLDSSHSLHAHSCFEQGTLYREYVTQYHAPESINRPQFE